MLKVKQNSTVYTYTSFSSCKRSFSVLFLRLDKPAHVLWFSPECVVVGVFFNTIYHRSLQRVCTCIEADGSSVWSELGTVMDSPNTGILLSNSSKTLPATTPGGPGTSGPAAISSLVTSRAKWASAGVHRIRSNFHLWICCPLRTLQVKRKTSKEAKGDSALKVLPHHRESI